MGGRIRHFLSEWRVVTNDQWVLAVVEHGYKLDFSVAPPLSKDPPEFTLQTSPCSLAMHEAIHGLLSKEAIRVVNPSVDGPGFYNHFFLVPKKTGGWRPILNLRPLNRFLRTESFSMETTKSILAAVRPGDWMVSIDLKDAYFHIAIHEDFRKYLRFAINGTVYEYIALPFGLASAPRIFTRVVLELIGFVHRQSIRTHPYLDDWLLLHQNRDVLHDHLVLVWSVLLRLGFIPSLEKSALTPSRDTTFVGMRLITQTGVVCPTQDRVDKLLTVINSILIRSSVPVKRILEVIGMMVSMLAIVPWARLRLRPIQLYLLALWRPSRQPLTYIIRVRPMLRVHLWWWLDPENLLKGVPLQAPQPTQFLFTDASTSGWGAHLDELTTSGTWSRDQRERHINWLELQAVFLALQRFQPSVVNQHVLVNTDNATVVAYINKMGGRDPQHCVT